ncbi:hypothetical protein ACN28S_54080 [Cystobacter fuscus]
MSRIVWSVGVGGLALALLAAPWLSRPEDGVPVEPVSQTPAEPPRTAAPSTPSPPAQDADLPPPHHLPSGEVTVSWAVLPPER